MAFNGTRDYPKGGLRQRLNELGISIGRHSNATTRFNSTIYTIKLDVVDDHRLAVAIDVLSQWARYIEFDPGSVKSEIPVVLEEWRMRKPLAARWYAQVSEQLYKDSHYSNRKPIGTSKSIKAVTAEKLRRI